MAANISGRDEDSQNRTNTYCIAIPRALRERSTVKFGSVIAEIKR